MNWCSGPLSKTHSQAISRRWTSLAPPQKGQFACRNWQIYTFQRCRQLPVIQLERASGQRRKVAGPERQGRRRRAWANPSALCVSFNVASIILQEAKQNPIPTSEAAIRASAAVWHTTTLCSVYRFNAIFITSAYCSLTPCSAFESASQSATTESTRLCVSIFFTEFQHRNSALPHKKESASFHFSCAQFELYAQSKFREPRHWLSLNFHKFFATWGYWIKMLFKQ